MIAKDKLLHFIVGSFISFPLILLFNYYGLIISILIFAAKEIIYDYALGKGNMEVLDFVYSCVPAIKFIILYNL